MSDSTIPQLPSAGSVDPTDLVPVDQGGVTKKATVGQLQKLVGAAPATGPFVVKNDSAAFFLPNAFNLGGLTSGVLKQTVASGNANPAIATPAVDYVAPGPTTTSGLTESPNTLLGRTTAGTGAVEEISVGANLSLAAGVLSAPNSVVTGPVTTSGLTENTNTLLGRSTAGTGAIEEITLGSGLSLSAGTLNTTGSVTNVSVTTANGFAGTVANPTTTPAISVQTTVTGLLKGNGTAVSAATAGTDFEAPITAGTTSQYYRGDKTFQTLNTAAVLLSNADPSADINDLADQMNHFSSAGTTDGAVLTDNGNGTVNISASNTFIRADFPCTITRSGNTATVTVTDPNFIFHSGDRVFIKGADQPQYNGLFYIIALSTTQFTYTVQGSPATPATGTIKVTDEHTTLYLKTVPAITNLALSNHLTNYIFVDWNAGSPVYTSTIAPTTFAGLARVLVYTVAREGTTLYVVDNRGVNIDAANKSNNSRIATFNFHHELGGTNLTATGTRNIAVSAGAFWYGTVKIPHSAFDTSVSDTFTTAYTPDNGTTWVYTAGQTQISNTQYNNVATGLASVTAGNYGVFWVYLMNNLPSNLLVLYGQGDYNKSNAFASQEPTIKPNIVSGVGSLIGRIIVKQGATSFTNITSSYAVTFPNPAPDLDSLADVNVPSPNLSEVLTWNGTVWTNAPVAAVSAGKGTTFYQATPQIIAPTVNNGNLALWTMAKSPTVGGSDSTVTLAATATTTAFGSWILSSAIGRTTIDAGLWTFDHWCSSSNAGNINNFICQAYQVVPAVATTVTVTGSGTTRTVTASGDAPFAATGYFSANATNTTASYIQTPSGLFQISARTSDTVVTIITPTGYVNESAVAYKVWNKLFGATLPDVASVTAAEFTVNSVQSAFTVNTTDVLGEIIFGNTTGGARTFTVYFAGPAHQSFVSSPLSTLHNDLAGLQGGTSNEDFHLTNAEYTGTGSGTFVRATSPTLVTPALGTPASGDLRNCSLAVAPALGSTTPNTVAATAMTATSAVISGALTAGNGINCFNNTTGNVALRAGTGTNAAGTAGQGIEVYWDATGSGTTNIQSYDRTGAAYKDLRLTGNTVTLYSGATLVATLNSTGLFTSGIYAVNGVGSSDYFQGVSAGISRVVASGGEVIRFASAGVSVTGTLSSTSVLTITGDNNVTAVGGNPHSIIKAGDTNNDYALHAFQTSAGGTIAVIGAKATTTGAYPNSIGELHLAVQNGAGTSDVVQISNTGVNVANALNVTGTGGSGYIGQFYYSGTGTGGIVTSGYANGSKAVDLFNISDTAARISKTDGTNIVTLTLNTTSAATLDKGLTVTGAVSATSLDTTAANTFSKAQRGAVTALSVSSNAIAVDLALANNFSVTLQATTGQTLSNPTNAVAGQSGQIAITQNGTPSTLAFGTNWISTDGTTPAVSTTASAVNLLTYYVVDSTHIWFSLNKHGVA